MNILDYIWFLIKVIGSLTILTFICSLFLSIIIDMIHREQDRKRKNMLNDAITEALKNGDFEMGVFEKPTKQNKSKKD